MFDKVLDMLLDLRFNGYSDTSGQLHTCMIDILLERLQTWRIPCDYKLQLFNPSCPGVFLSYHAPGRGT